MCQWHRKRIDGVTLGKDDGLDGTPRAMEVVNENGKRRTRYIDFDAIAARKAKRVTASWPICPHGGTVDVEAVINNDRMSGYAQWRCSECGFGLNWWSK